jgi:hypothetical protein
MFYTTGVDICNTKSMWNFIKNHYTYYTLNSWNRQKSIAHNVKLYNLDLEGDWTVAMNYLFDESDAGLLQMYIDDEIKEFEKKYPYYEVAANGRSGGYLVIYEKQGHGSIIPDCVDDYDTYEDFKEEIKSCWHGINVADFNRELREVVEIVREFDKLCDRLRDLVNAYSKRSFDVDKLEDALDRFSDQYGDDLELLSLEGPVLEDDRVKLNEIDDFNAFMQCFFGCFGEDRRRITVNNGYLWLKER